jgi:hypothetical protein
MSFHLAQVNVARAVADFADPILAGLADRIGEINALAEKSPGFVWRYESAAGDLDYLRPFDGYFTLFEPQRIFFNMSVWETVEDLKNYVFHTAHAELFRQKGQWMTSFERPHLALWWVPAGHVPTVEEGKEKLLLIERDGPTPSAFTFARSFPKPGK